METTYLGGMVRRDAAERRKAASVLAGGEAWGTACGDQELFLHATGLCCRLFTWEGLLLLLRGYARPANSSGPHDLERVAEEVRCHYLEHGDLAVEGLEGSFTLALLDGQARPAAILGLPVGFVGAAESKQALATLPHGIPFLTVHGRRGGSAMAVAALNAIASERE